MQAFGGSISSDLHSEEVDDRTVIFAFEFLVEQRLDFVKMLSVI